MPFLIVCPSGHRLKVPKKHAGQRIACPVCNASIAVPRPPQANEATDASANQPTAPPGPLLRPFLEPTPQPGPAVAPEHPPEPKAADSRPTERTVREGEPSTAAEPAGSSPGLQQPLPDEHTPPPNFPPWQDRSGQSFEGDGWDSRHSPAAAEQSFHREQKTGVWVLGVASILVALLCASPSLVDQFASRRDGLKTADSWTYLVLLAATIHISVAIFAMGLPDWSTSWVASLMTTGCAALYATGLALTMFANQEHQLVRTLGLLDEAFHHQAQLWCFLVMCLTLILAYSYGRFSLRWYQTEKRLMRGW